MPNYYWKTADGVVDGVNTTYQTHIPYAPGSLAVYINGVLGFIDTEPGWVETDPDSGTFDLLEPVLEGNAVQAFYADEPFVPQPQVDLEGEIQGQLDVVELNGSISVVGLTGAISPSLISGQLDLDTPISGELVAEITLSGEVCVCHGEE